MNRLAAVLAALAVAELGRHVWHAYTEMCCDIATLDNRVRQLEAPHDTLAYEIDMPKRWRR